MLLIITLLLTHLNCEWCKSSIIMNSHLYESVKKGPEYHRLYFRAQWLNSIFSWSSNWAHLQGVNFISWISILTVWDSNVINNASSNELDHWKHISLRLRIFCLQNWPFVEKWLFQNNEKSLVIFRLSRQYYLDM